VNRIIAYRKRKINPNVAKIPVQRARRGHPKGLVKDEKGSLPLSSPSDSKTAMKKGTAEIIHPLPLPHPFGRKGYFLFDQGTIG
jgi:hypothetical protein